MDNNFKLLDFLVPAQNKYQFKKNRLFLKGHFFAQYAIFI